MRRCVDGLGDSSVALHSYSSSRDQDRTVMFWPGDDSGTAHFNEAYILNPATGAIQTVDVPHTCTAVLSLVAADRGEFIRMLRSKPMEIRMV
jgi:hypothetical protein